MEYVYFYGPLWNELAVTSNYFTHPFASFSNLPGFKIPDLSQANKKFPGTPSSRREHRGHDKEKTPGKLFPNIKVHYGHEIFVQSLLVI